MNARRKYLDKIHELWKQGLISDEIQELHSRYARSRYYSYYGIKGEGVERQKIMREKGWTAWPCREMFGPEGTLDVW